MLDALRRSDFDRDSRFYGTLVDGDWVVDFEGLETAVRQACEEDRRVVVAGTAFGFVHWLDRMQAVGNRFRLPAGSCVMETGGYKGRSRVLTREALHLGIRNLLGLNAEAIVCEYGMSELSSQAYDRIAGQALVGARRRFQFPPWCRAYVVNPETRREVAIGELGVLQMFDLANVASVMGVWTEDQARRESDGFEWIGRAAVSEPRGCSLMTADGLGTD